MSLQALDFLPALLVALSSSFHCVFMCGGFVLAAGAGEGGERSTRVRMVRRQLLYHLGKASTYLFLGALAGLAGEVIVRTGETWYRTLVFLAGLFLLATGFHSLGWLGRPVMVTVPARPGKVSALRRLLLRLADGWSRSGRRILEHRTPLRPLFLGAFSGFLPCPLVYGFLAAAAATGSVLHALVILAALGLGTAPALLGVALGGSAVSPVVRLRMARLGGLLVVALALYTWYRGWFLPPCHHLQAG